MTRRCELPLSAPQRETLEAMRDHHPKPYLREKAAALLKVAAGDGLGQSRATAYWSNAVPTPSATGWRSIDAWGSAACGSKLVAGASPLFPPQPATALAATTELETLVHRPPSAEGLTRSRWWLDGVRQHVAWLAQRSLTTVWRWLRRAGLPYKRGRRTVHSHDPEYDAKLAKIAGLVAQARAEPERVVLVYEDELTYYRKPTVGRDYAARGSKDPRVEQGWGTNRKRRIASSLNLVTGQRFSWQRAHFDRATFRRYLDALAAQYPRAECIWVVLDNWPVHFHPEVVAALEGTKVHLVRLPTYAPWTNPTEKVWLKLYAEVLHLHQLAKDWDALQTRVETWLKQYADGSISLLRFVGLSSG